MKFLTKIILINILVSASIFAQGFGSHGAINAKNIALGSTNAVSSRGVFALGVNPANLVVAQNHKIEVSTILPLPTLNVTVGNDFFTLNDYQYFFTGVEGADGQSVGRHLTESDKQKFLALFDEGTLINTNVGTTLLAFSIYPNKQIGAVGFSISDWTSMNVNFPTGIMELVLYGNKKGQIFDMNNTDMESWYLRNYSLSYSRDISKLFRDAFKFFSVGLSVKMVHGLFYSGIDKMNTSLETLDDNTIRVNGDSRILMATSPSFGVKYDFDEEGTANEQSIGLFNTPAGTGLGVDFGIYAEINKVWSFAVALTDLGSINWNKGTVAYTSEGSFLLENVSDEGIFDSLSNALQGEGAYTDAFSTSLATAMKLGIGFNLDKLLKGKFPGEMMIEFNYHQGFNNMPSNSTKERFSLGLEWAPINWFKFRSGASVGGYDKFNWAMGLGFITGIVDLDFAASYFNSYLDGNDAKRLGFAMSSRWTF